MDIVSKITFTQKQVEIIFNQSKKLIVSKRIFRAFSLQEGQSVDLRAYLPQIAQAQQKEALHSAFGYLTIRDRSTTEIQEALRKKGYANSVAQAVLQELMAKGFVNDERFANHFAQVRLQQGYGKQRILQELRQKGIESSIATQALENIDYKEIAFLNACTIAQKYAKRYEDLSYANKQKIIQALVRKGYSISMAIKAVQSLQED